MPSYGYGNVKMEVSGVKGGVEGGGGIGYIKRCNHRTHGGKTKHTHS